jgi:hypothetical protein
MLFLIKNSLVKKGTVRWCVVMQQQVLLSVCCDATASSFIAKVSAKIFLHFLSRCKMSQ